MSQLEFTDAEWASLAAEFCKGFTKEQSEVCRTFCRVRGLMPGKHVVFSLRQSSEWDETVGAKVKVSKIVFITTIDAARLIALRSGQYNGQEPETYIYLDDNGNPSIESHVPLPQTPLPPRGQTPLPREPWAVRTTVYRKDFDHPITSVARFDAYAATYKTPNGPQLTEIWSKRPGEQLAKCSEMLSLRKGFPEELSNLYLDLELKNESPQEEKTPSVTPASVVPMPVVVPPVNQTPAQGTSTPRPNEAPPVETPKPAEPDKSAVAAAKAAVPDLKPASEIPEPKKRGRKPTKPEIPEQGITNEDLEPPKNVPTENPESKKEAEAFVDSVTNFTPSEAAAQGLPEPPDYSRIPEKGSEELKKFTGRVREFTAKHGMVPADLKQFFLQESGKSDINLLTVRDWETSLKKLDDALAAGTLKQTVKPAPLPEF